MNFFLLSLKQFFTCLFFKQRWFLWTMLGPILPLPILFVDMGRAASTRCAYACVWIAFYWVTEPIPIGITAFMPLLLFPLLDIIPSSEIASSYFNDTLFLLLTSMMFAAGLEKYHLHTKIALKFLLFVGHRPLFLLAGFVSVTTFLSMWLSNTATTAMMTPIALAVLEHIEKDIKAQYNQDCESMYNEANEIDLKSSQPSSPHDENTKLVNQEQEKQMNELNRYGIALLLGICYGASIGGTTTLIGTGSNLVLTSQMRELFPLAPEISFAKWFVMAFPLVFVVVIVLLFILWIKYAKNATFHIDMSVLQNHYDRLGPFTFPQKVFIVDFLMMIILWFSRINFDGTKGGWSILFYEDYVTDTTVIVLGVFILFFIPSRQEQNLRIFTNDIFKAVSWDIVFVLAGGFGLARGITKSGLSVTLSDNLGFVSTQPTYLTLVIVCLATVFMTEFTSNVSTISVFVPVLAALSVAIHQNPLLLLIPSTLSSSYAFMLPVATPPNAIVFSSGRMKVYDMVTTGGILNFLGLFIVPAFLLLFRGIFDIEPGVLPFWATFKSNQTTT